jgi:hypothetical protein
MLFFGAERFSYNMKMMMMMMIKKKMEVTISKWLCLNGTHPPQWCALALAEHHFWLFTYF